MIKKLIFAAIVLFATHQNMSAGLLEKYQNWVIRDIAKSISAERPYRSLYECPQYSDKSLAQLSKKLDRKIVVDYIIKPAATVAFIGASLAVIIAQHTSK